MKKIITIKNLLDMPTTKSDQNLEIESELTDQILEEICIDIFNKTFVNW